MEAKELDSIKQILLAEGKYTCFHRIKEVANKEFVGVVPAIGGWELRGCPTAETREQQWLIYPLDATWCKIFTLSNNECAAVAPTSLLVRWGDNKGPEQMFCFSNHHDDNNSWNIIVKHTGKNVAVGSSGLLLEYHPTGTDEQRFILEPIPASIKQPKKKEPDVTLGKPRYPVDVVKDADLKESSPIKSEEYLIDVEMLPSIFVNDPERTDKVEQVREEPYYYLVRKRHWERTSAKRLLPGMKEGEITTVKKGTSHEDHKSIETTLGVVVKAKGSVSVGDDPGDKGGRTANVSGSLSTQFSWQRTEKEDHTDRTEESSERVQTWEYTPQIECTVHAWQPVDTYSLYNYQEKVVKTWSVFDKEVIWKSYPDQAIQPVAKDNK